MTIKFHFLIIYASSLFVFTGKAQQFINGDLEGPGSAPSTLPANWQNVPYSDVNCVASNIGDDTPDLTDTLDLGVSAGLCGRPYSGLTFVSGLVGETFQEGIMQNVSSLEKGKTYTINFYQSVVKQNNALDKSGSWSVYIDSVLAGTTLLTHSEAIYNSLSFPWEERNITFTATATSHLIKFLPIDNDANGTFSMSDTAGALRMGIDAISLSSATGVKELIDAQTIILDQNAPNPFAEQTSISYYLPEFVSKAQIVFYEQTGKILKTVDLTEKGNGVLNIFASDLTSSFYIYSLIIDGQVVETKKMVKQ